MPVPARSAQTLGRTTETGPHAIPAAVEPLAPIDSLRAEWNAMHAELPMPIELPKEAHKEAVASIERYYQENMEERIGNIAAAALLNYFLEEVGPSIYNKAVADVQERLQQRILELDIEVHEEEFQYRRKYERPSRSRK